MYRLSQVVRLTLAGAGALFLAACSTVPQTVASTQSNSQAVIPATATAPATQPAQAAVPAESRLTPELLYRLLTAEIAGQRGDLHFAVRQYLAAA